MLRLPGVLLVAAVCGAGCAAPALRTAEPATTNLQRGDAVGVCAELYRSFDHAVVTTGVGDAQSARVPGFPYLRINRFLAEIAPGPDAPTFGPWVDRLVRLDRQARSAEFRNLPGERVDPRWETLVEDCAATLRDHDLAGSSARTQLAAAAVPDDYRTWQRVAGVYPLTSLPFLRGVRNLHRETAATFATPLEALPLRGELTRYAPLADGAGQATLSTADVAALLGEAADNPLRIPEPDRDQRQQLFATFAPIWEIDVADDADRPGELRVDAARPARVSGSPRVYTLISHALWQGEPVLQLNYVVWFAERPKQGAFDLLGGNIDGITWRVTLGRDGQPLLYDSIHNCGCYHKVYATPRVRLARASVGREEPILVAQTLTDRPGRLVVRVSASSHYVQRAYRAVADQPAGQTYRMRGYDSLRAQPVGEGRSRSAFRPDGLIAGTERLERWLFWPMGVPEPGAMRQWGTHAIAFVGRRHFDDPRLLARYFEPAGRPAGRPGR